MAPTLPVSRSRTLAALLLRQFANPLVLVLIIVSGVSLLLHEILDAAVVLLMVLGSATLGFTQEYLAGNAVARLMARVAVTVTVQRAGRTLRLPVAEVAIDDEVLLVPGTMLPGDGVVMEARDLLLDQSTMTGESFPVEKSVGSEGFHGTSVVSGQGRLRVAAVGVATRYGRVARHLADFTGRSAFEQGLHDFGILLARFMLAMVGLVAGANLLLGRPGVESLLFATALAVGLTPELLPAILSVNLAHGARRMAQAGVIVRRLDAIENLGSMDVLCTDKTGTLTIGAQSLQRWVDPSGRPDNAVLQLGWWNVLGQTASGGALDSAVTAAAQRAGLVDASGTARLVVDSIPYDFHRKCCSTVIDMTGRHRIAGARDPTEAPAGRVLITKGAVREVLARCTGFAGPNGSKHPLDEATLDAMETQFAEWSAAGYRVLAVAVRAVPSARNSFTREDEASLMLSGFLLFTDPAREDAGAILATLATRGVDVKLLTGDNRHIAVAVASAVGLPSAPCLTGDALRRLPDDRLGAAIATTNVFAELDPELKEQIVLALRHRGRVVGFLGDGINDAAALHAADVGVSVNSAADIAREAADFVLLEKSLASLCDGLDEGRRTHANTLKYVLTTTSANFGNMLSMAVASLFLPFFPLLASQVLLNNLLSDLPAMAIATDRVDAKDMARPHRWDNRRIRNLMMGFGSISSVFDFLTFAVLLWVTHATAVQFRTGWFTESLLTELWVALVVRTSGSCLRSRPGTLLLATTMMVTAVAWLLPLTPLGGFFGFEPLPVVLQGIIVALTLAYLGAVEFAKRWLLRPATPTAAAPAAQPR